MVKAGDMNQAKRDIVSFRVGLQWYGIGVEAVVEVLPMVILTELPTSSPDVLGLITVRNAVIPVIDLRLRFRQSDPQYQLDTPIMILRTHSGAIGVLVDEIDNVEAISEEQITATLGAELPFIAGTAQLSDKLLM